MPVSAKRPVDISRLSEKELNTELEKGYADLITGRTLDASNVFEQIREEHGIDINATSQN